MSLKSNITTAVFCLLTGLGGAVGGYLWSAHHFDVQRNDLMTYAFVRGACGNDLSSCNGDIDITTAEGTSAYKYSVAHGAVFDRNATGKDATITVTLPAPCTADGPGTCQFVRATTAQQ